MKVYKKYFLLALAFYLPGISWACSVCQGGYTPKQIECLFNYHGSFGVYANHNGWPYFLLDL